MSESRKKHSLKKVFSRKVNRALIGIGIVGASIIGLKQYNSVQTKLAEEAKIEAYNQAKTKALNDWNRWDSLSVYEKEQAMYFKNLSLSKSHLKQYAIRQAMFANRTDSLVYKGTDEEKIKLAQFFEKIALSETGKGLVENLDSMKVEVSFPKKLNPYGVYLDANRELLLREESAVPKSLSMIWLASHEMRHCVQDAKKIIGVGYDSLSVSERFFVGKLVEADACAYGAQVVWELKQKGVDLGWDNLKTNPTYGRCFTAYEDAVKKNPKADKNGEALRASFEAWYSHKGLQITYEKTMCGNIFRHSPETNNPREMYAYGKINYKKIREHIAKIGMMKNGKNYLTDVSFGNSEDILDRNSKYWKVYMVNSKVYKKAVEAVEIAIVNKEGPLQKAVLDAKLDTSNISKVMTTSLLPLTQNKGR